MPIFFGVEFVLRRGGFVVGEFFEGKKGSEWAGLVVARGSSLVGKDVMILGDGGVEDVGESGANGDVVVGLDGYEAISLVCFFVFFVIGGDGSSVCSVKAGGEGAGDKARAGGLMLVELFGFVEEVLVVRLAAVLGVRPISCVGAIFLVTRFYVFFVGWRSGRDVGPLGAGLVFAAYLFTASGVGEVN
jgi:hypothetical protein